MGKSLIMTLHVTPEIYTKYEEALKVDDGSCQGAQRAAPLYKQCADAGHDKAQVRYAFMCLTGKGAPQSNDEAYKYFKMAAINYNWTGKVEVGICYFLGIGTRKMGNYAEFHLKRCANKLMLKGQYYYAELLYQGPKLFGFGKDRELAVAYMAAAAINQYEGASEELMKFLGDVQESSLWERYNKIKGKKRFLAPGILYGLALKNNADAMYNFAVNIFKGDGFPKNFNLAFKFAKMAADLKYVKAYQLVGYLYLKGYGTEKDCKNAFYYYEMASNEGFESAYFNLGLLYMEGTGVEQNYDNAFHYFEKAANGKCSQAFYFLAKLYKEGKGTDVNIEKYVENIEKAANMGFFKAIHEYALYCYEHQEYENAVHYFYMSSKYGDVTSCLYLGELCEKGLGVVVNPKNAVSWYNLGVFINGCYRLANCYENGIGVEKNIDEAINLYKKASLKHKEAKDKYDELTNNKC